MKHLKGVIYAQGREERCCSEEVIIELQLCMTAVLFNYWTGDKIKLVSNEPVNKPVCCDSVLTSSVVIGGLQDVITLSVK